MVQIYKQGKGQTIVVLPPVPILKKQTARKWTRFYYEEPSAERCKAWTKFSKALKGLGIKTIKVSSERELSGTEAVLVDSLWRK